MTLSQWAGSQEALLAISEMWNELFFFSAIFFHFGNETSYEPVFKNGCLIPAMGFVL
jgi:hypothetical protein